MSTRKVLESMGFFDASRRIVRLFIEKQQRKNTPISRALQRISFFTRQLLTSTMQTIVQAGRILFIRMMPRSDLEENRANPIYTLQAFINGKLDDQLIWWALEAIQFN